MATLPPADPWADKMPRHLSPSRAADFMQCPLLYRFKVVDRLPDPPTVAAVRGTLVHQVLEDLFGWEPWQRTVAAAADHLPVAWETVRTARPEYVDNAVWGETTRDDLFAQCRALLEVYFTLEDPGAYLHTAQETQVDVSAGQVPLFGYIDRIDTNTQGWERLTDYKTGKAPPPTYRGKALWQLRFYALARLLETGTLPKQLRLLYLGDGGQTVTHTPTGPEIDEFATHVEDLWARIVHAFDTGHFEPQPSKLCDWCPFRMRCPAQRP